MRACDGVSFMSCVMLCFSVLLFVAAMAPAVTAAPVANVATAATIPVFFTCCFLAFAVINVASDFVSDVFLLLL